MTSVKATRENALRMLQQAADRLRRLSEGLIHNLSKGQTGLNLFSHSIFQNKPLMLNRIQIGRVRGEVEQVATGLLNERLDAAAFVE